MRILRMEVELDDASRTIVVIERNEQGSKDLQAVGISYVLGTFVDLRASTEGLDKAFKAFEAAERVANGRRS